MGAIVDWISISLPVVLRPMPTLPGIDMSDALLLGQGGQWLEEWMSSFDDLEMMHGRSPFNKSIRSEYGGWRYYYDATQGGSLLEISGVGCKRLRDIESDIAIVREFADRITRIDIAVDLESDVDPEEFAYDRTDGKFKSGAVMKSGNGNTVYIGSRKSDRYARIYRYYDPHPRSKFLRVEMVCKGKAARPTCDLFVRGMDALDVGGMLGNSYGWYHAAWNLQRLGTVDAAPRRYKAAGTEIWLMKQVLPACRKLANKGQVDSLTYLRDQLTMLISEASKEG